jgi:hypothetical protein
MDTESIQFDHAVFADMGAVQSQMQQFGSDVVIAEDAQNLVTLHNVLLSNLHASDARGGILQTGRGAGRKIWRCSISRAGSLGVC